MEDKQLKNNEYKQHCILMFIQENGSVDAHIDTFKNAIKRARENKNCITRISLRTGRSWTFIKGKLFETPKRIISENL